MYQGTGWELTQDVDDNSTSGELAWAFAFLVKEHTQQSREQNWLYLTQLLQSEICGSETFEAEQSLVKQCIFVLLTNKSQYVVV